MFDHERFDVFAFEDMPLDCDIFVVSDEYMPIYEEMMLRVFEGEDWSPVGYVSYAAVNAVGAEQADLSWYANVSDRFHEISVSLPRDQFVSLTIYDVAGRLVDRAINTSQSAGEHTFTWDARTLPSGIYFYRLQTGSFSETKRMILLK